MTNANKQIKISSILYLFGSMIFVPFAPEFGSVLLILGVILLANSFLSLEELKKNRASLIIIALISVLINIPSAVLIFISLDEISSIRLERNNAPPTTESKRIDLLLKLGLTMILISGILFATTTWEIISNLVKVIALVGMGAAFLGLSKFSEIKLKIENTTKAYFILGLSFFLLTWVGIGYFGVISPWFSYAGEGKNLVYFITLILLAAFLYLINHKFKEKEYLYMGHMSIYISIYHLLAAFGLDLLSVSIILSLISLVINILPNSKLLSTLKDINYPTSYLFSAIILTQCFEANKYVVLAACIINIINVLFISFKKKTSFNHILSMIISYILLLIATLKLNMSATDIILFTVLSLFALFVKYQKFDQSKYLVSTSQIIYNVVTTILLFVIAADSLTKALIVSSIYLVLNILNSLDLYKNNEQVDFRYQPFVIFIFFVFLQSLFNEEIINIGTMLMFSLSAFVYAIIYHLAKKEQVKKHYFIMLLISLGMTLFFNLIYGEIVPALTTLLLTIYVYFTRKKEEVAPRVLLYIATLVNVYITSMTLTYYEVSEAIANIICLVVFVFLTIFVKDSKLKTINYIAIAVPLYNLVNTIDMAENLQLLVTNVFWLYILFLFVKFLIQDKDAKDLIATVGLSIIILSVIFRADILIGIYIGILSIAIIFITFNAEHFKKLFYCGVVITVVNIVVQLWEFWTQIPFYLYLLVVGIAIIAFVTYKELHKKNEPVKHPITQPEKFELMPAEPETIKEELVNEQPQTVLETEVEMKEEIKEQPVEELVQPEEIKQEEKYVPRVARFCPSCGTENHEGKFCRRCGRNLQL